MNLKTEMAHFRAITTSKNLRNSFALYMPVTDYITCLPLTAELGQVKSNAKTWKSLFITNMPTKIVLNCGVLYHGMINPGMA